MQQKLEEKDENTVEIKETFSSLQQEVDSKTKKLKKVKKRFNRIQSRPPEWQRFKDSDILNIPSCELRDTFNISCRDEQGIEWLS